MIESVEHAQGRRVMGADILFAEFHLIAGQAHFDKNLVFILLNKLPPEASGHATLNAGCAANRWPLHP